MVYVLRPGQQAQKFKSNILLTRSNYQDGTNTMIHTFPTALKVVDAEIAVTNFAAYNSFMNISGDIGNNFLTFFFPILTGVNTWVQTPFTLLLRDGYYSFKALREALQLFCVQQGLYLIDPESGLNVYFLDISVNSVEYRGQLDLFRLPTAAEAATLGWQIPPGSPIVLNTGNQHPSPYFGSLNPAFAEVIGFEPGVYPSALTGPYSTAAFSTTPAYTILSQKAPNVNRVSSIIIRCNMVNSTTSNPVDMLSLVPIDAQYGALTRMDAPFPTFAHTSEGTFSTLELALYDQMLRPVIFFDPEITLTLQLRTRE